MTSYGEAERILGHRESKKLGNNTYLERFDDDTIVIKLHSTYVVTYCKNGDVILDSGGWQSKTTKDRINKYSPVGVHQKKREWFLDDGREFFDRIIVR